MNLNFEKIMEQARGRWVGIFRQLGIAIREDGKHGPCPLCGGKDRARFDDKEGNGTTFCSQCGSRNGVMMVKDVMGVDIREAFKAVAGVVGGCEQNAVPKENKITPELLHRMFNGASKATNEDMVGKYLKSRGLSVVPPNSLWFSPGCWESETKQNQRAMLGVFQMSDGKAVCVHRTYLGVDSEKMDIKSPKKLSPALVNCISGGAIRLFPVDGEILGIAEGIETAIAAHEEMNIPVWAAVSSTLMEKFIPPDSVKNIVVIADNDKNFTGQKSAYILAHRLTIKHGVHVSVHVPESPGDDWLDVLNNCKEK